MYFIKRITYKTYLQIRINLLWIFWYLRNSKKVLKISRIFDTWNREIPSFPIKFPYLNTKTFIKNYKYWIHWITKMDVREKLVFKDFNPFLLINEEEWIHLDLSIKEVPIIYYSFYSADYEWIPIIIFKSLDQLQCYVSITETNSDNLISYIKTNVQTERLLISKERILKKNEGFEKVIIDEEGLRLNPEYIKQLKEMKEKKQNK